jgi:hypothetical protein
MRAPVRDAASLKLRPKFLFAGQEVVNTPHRQDTHAHAHAVGEGRGGALLFLG